MRNIDLAGVIVCLNLPDDLIAPEFEPFLTDESLPADIVVELADAASLEDLPGEEYTEYDTPYCLTCIGTERIRTFFHNVDNWIGLSVVNNKVLCVPEEGFAPSVAQCRALFDLMKGGIFLQLRKYGVFVLHSSSVICDGKVFAFSAASGIGKTTHAELLKSLYGLSYFNGDMLAIKAGESPTTAYGLPWSGCSGATTAGSLPLGGVFFLRQAEANEIIPIDGVAKLAELTQRMLSANYNHDVFLENCALLQDTARELPCFILNCLPNRDAAKMSFTQIQKLLANRTCCP